MKKILFFICSIFFAAPAIFAQELPALGQLSPEEIALVQCSFDKDAVAVILLHEAVSDYDSEQQLITMHHIKIKILKESGISEANISIPFFRKDDFEVIDEVEGMTININPDGSISKEKVDRKSIFTKQTNERIGEVVFAFPAVKKGSVIDYRYQSTMKHYGGLEDWYFQEKIPVISSKYELTIIPNTEFAYRVNKREDLQVIIKPDPSHGKVYFEMNNIPGLQDEPYMDARKDYIQKIIFQLSSYNHQKYLASWDAVSTELLSTPEFGGQLKKNLDAGDIIKQANLLATPEEKLRAIYNYVRSSMNWNGLYSKYSSGGIKDAWKKRSGTSGEINLILVNLLNEAGLEAYPILVSERFNGKVNVDYPFIDQFNSVFACVFINSKRYHLDATDLFCPAHITPFDILNTIGFIVKRKSGSLVNIINDSLRYKENISIFMEVKEDGTASGNATVTSEDYARAEKLKGFKRNKEQYKNNYFANEGVSWNIKKLEIKNEEIDSLPLEQQFEFSTSLNSSGDYKYIPLNLMQGFRSNPFLNENRFSNINFGYKRSIVLTVNIKLPAGYAVDNLPKPVKMITPDQEIFFERQVLHDAGNNSIYCKMELEFRNSLYLADDYATLKQVYKKLFEYLKEPVLLKKK